MDIELLKPEYHNVKNNELIHPTNTVISVFIIPIMLNGRVSHQKRASEPLKRS